MFVCLCNVISCDIASKENQRKQQLNIVLIRLIIDPESKYKTFGLRVASIVSSSQRHFTLHWQH